jgi:hypothetical protein
MATSPTLLLSPRYTEDSRALRAAAVAAGWDCIRLASWRVPEWVRSHELVFYGEPLLAEVIGEQRLPYVLLEPPPDWLPGLPSVYAGRDIRFTTLGQARRHPARAFFKPADLLKSFRAGVYDSGAGIPDAETQPDELPVLVQEAVAWELEVRCFVLERRAVTSSPYLRHGNLAQAADGSWPVEEDELKAAEAFAATVLADPAVDLPPAVVLDVGVIAARGWAVIEANAAWGAGLYGCDPTAVLAVLRRATVPRRALTAEDRRWVGEASTRR